MKRKTVSLAMVVLLTAALAFAASPHWIGTPDITFTDRAVKACFKEAGLGNNRTIDYRLTVTADAVYNCVNRGGNCPQSENKTVSTNIVGLGSFSSGKNGHVTACIEVQYVDDPESVLVCPPGQESTLTSVEYHDVVLEDLTNGLSSYSDMAFSKTYYLCNH